MQKSLIESNEQYPNARENWPWMHEMKYICNCILCAKSGRKYQTIPSWKWSEPNQQSQLNSQNFSKEPNGSYGLRPCQIVQRMRNHFTVNEVFFPVLLLFGHCVSLGWLGQLFYGGDCCMLNSNGKHGQRLREIAGRYQ